MANQLWLSRCQTPSASTAVYWPPTGGPTIGEPNSGTEANVSGIVSANGGTLKSMYVRLTVAPGGAANRLVRVVVNGTPSGVLTLTISAGDTTGTVTGNVSLVAGDTISVETTPSGTPAASDVFVSLEYQPTTANYFLYPQAWGYGGQPSSLSVTFTPALNTGIIATGVINSLADVAPFACTVREIYIKLSVAPGADKSRTFAFCIAGAEQGSTFPISGTDTVSNNTGLAIAVAAGDRLTLTNTPTNTPAATRVKTSLVLEPTTPGLCALVMSSALSISNISGNNFLQPVGSADNFTNPLNATEANVQMPIPLACTLSAIYGSMQTSVNTGAETLTITARKNGVATSLAATFNSGNGTLVTDTGTDSFIAGDLLSWLITSAESTGDMDNWSFGLAAQVAGKSSRGGPGKGGKPGGGPIRAGRGGRWRTSRESPGSLD